MRRTGLAFAFMSVLGLAHATDIRDALSAASAAPDGRFSGTLSGPLAEGLRRKLNTTAPVTLDVIVIHRFADPGCNRYQIDFKIPAPGGATPFGMQMNVCADGSAPRDAASYQSATPAGMVPLDDKALGTFFKRSDAERRIDQTQNPLPARPPSSVPR